MHGLVLDTHAVIWYLAGSEKLSAKAVAAIEKSLNGGDPIYVSAISLVEIIYLVEKGRLPQSALRSLTDALSDPETGFEVAPLDMGASLEVQSISRDAVPDMPDRLIAATASYLGLPLVTRDSKIRASGVKVIW